MSVNLPDKETIISKYEQRPVEKPLHNNTISDTSLTVGGQSFTKKPGWGNVKPEWILNVAKSDKPLPDDAIPVTAVSHALAIHRFGSGNYEAGVITVTPSVRRSVAHWQETYGQYANTALIDIFSPFSPWWGITNEHLSVEHEQDWVFWEETPDMMYAEMAQYADDAQKEKLLATLMAWKAAFAFGKIVEPARWQSAREWMQYVDEQPGEREKCNNTDHANWVFSRTGNAGIRDALIQYHGPVIPHVAKRPKCPFPRVFFADDMYTLKEWNYGVENDYEGLRMQWLVGQTHLSPQTILSLLPYFLTFAEPFSKQYKKRADLFGWFCEWLIARMKKGNQYGIHNAGARNLMPPGLYLLDNQIRMLLDKTSHGWREVAFTYHQWMWLRSWVGNEPTMDDFDRLQGNQSVPVNEWHEYQEACKSFYL